MSQWIKDGCSFCTTSPVEKWSQFLILLNLLTLTCNTVEVSHISSKARPSELWSCSLQPLRYFLSKSSSHTVKTSKHREESWASLTDSSSWILKQQWAPPRSHVIQATWDLPASQSPSQYHVDHRWIALAELCITELWTNQYMIFVVRIIIFFIKSNILIHYISLYWKSSLRYLNSVFTHLHIDFVHFYLLQVKYIHI